MLLANTSGWDNGSHVLHFEMFVSFQVSKEEHYAFNQRGQSLLVDLRIGLVLGMGHVNPGPWRQELEKLYKIWLFGTLEITYIMSLENTKREQGIIQVYKLYRVSSMYWEQLCKYSGCSSSSCYWDLNKSTVPLWLQVSHHITVKLSYLPVNDDGLGFIAIEEVI